MNILRFLGKRFLVFALLVFAVLAMQAQYTTPKAPQYAEISQTGVRGEVRVEWRPVYSDINNQVYPVGSVTYSVYTLNGWTRTLVADKLTDCIYTFQAAEPGTQKFVQCLVFAYYHGLESDGAITEMIPVGTPYDSIFEPFADSKASYIWSLEYSSDVDIDVMNESRTGIASPDGADDGYLGIIGSNLTGIGRLYSGLISLDAKRRHFLSFDTYNNGGYNNNTINIYYVSPYSNEQTLIYSCLVDDAADAGLWGEVKIELSGFSVDPMQIMIEGVLNGDNIILIDNILVDNSFDYDLELVGISAPESAECGKTTMIDVLLRNVGLESASDYFVELYADNNLIDTKYVSAELDPKAETEVRFEYELGPQQVEPIAFRAELIWFDDQDEANNSSETVMVTPIPAKEPTPSDLSAEVLNVAILLDWTEPNLSTYTGLPELDFVGYNIYRDGTRINDVPVTVCSYRDETVLGNVEYEYFVTALYDDGRESAPSNVVTVTSSAVSIVDDVTEYICVEPEAICIYGDSGCEYAVYTTTGIRLRHGKLSNTHERIAVQPGVYVVIIGGKSAVVKVQ